MADLTNDIIQKIYEIYKQKGYISENSVFDLIIDAGLPLDETDRVIDRLLSMGVLIQDEPVPVQSEIDDDEENDVDRTQLDYEEIYSRVLEIDPSLDYIIDYVRQVPAPRTHEISNLMVQAKSGNEYARNRIIELMMKIAIKMALNFTERYHTDLGDTIQYAFEGLIIAYDKFEIGRQDNFTTYAPWWIRQNIDRTIDICAGIHTPVHIDEQIKHVSELMDTHYCDSCTQHDVCPNLIAEICEKVEVDEERAFTYIMFLTPSVSIEELVENEEEPADAFFFDDMLEEISQRELKQTLASILSTLTEKEQKVISMRYGLDDGEEKTLEEVGSEFNVTRERIRQIEAKVLRKLRHPSRSRRLKGFLDGPVRTTEEPEKKKDENKPQREETYAEKKKRAREEAAEYEEFIEEIPEETEEVTEPTLAGIETEEEYEYSEEKVKQLEALANDCDIDAMLELADLYYFNDFDEKALYWYETAAEFESAEGMYSAGIMYRDGQGTEQNYEKALEWFLKAAEQDHPGAINEVGVYYHNQKNMRGKHTEAIKWYKRAAELGELHAQCNLGWYYEYGLGCEPDIYLAKKYYELSAEQGFEDAIRYLKRINKKI